MRITTTKSVLYRYYYCSLMSSSFRLFNWTKEKPNLLQCHHLQGRVQDFDSEGGWGYNQLLHKKIVVFNCEICSAFWGCKNVMFLDYSQWCMCGSRPTTTRIKILVFKTVKQLPLHVEAVNVIFLTSHMQCFHHKCISWTFRGCHWHPLYTHSCLAHKTPPFMPEYMSINCPSDDKSRKY